MSVLLERLDALQKSPQDIGAFTLSATQYMQLPVASILLERKAEITPVKSTVTSIHFQVEWNDDGNYTGLKPLNDTAGTDLAGDVYHLEVGIDDGKGIKYLFRYQIDGKDHTKASAVEIRRQDEADEPFYVLDMDDLNIVLMRNRLPQDINAPASAMRIISGLNLDRDSCPPLTEAAINWRPLVAHKTPTLREELDKLNYAKGHISSIGDGFYRANTHINWHDWKERVFHFWIDRKRENDGQYPRIMAMYAGLMTNDQGEFEHFATYIDKDVPEYHRVSDDFSH